MNDKITILHLYPRDMNIYGDHGNVLVLKRRLEWYGYQAHVIEYNPGDALPKDVDLIIGGGGQDSGQLKVYDDLQKIAPTLKKWADEDKPMLMVCGMYQLFGRTFKTSDKGELKGIGIFGLETRATNERLVGNIVAQSDKFGEIVGYENHSGQTYLDKSVTPLASVIKGAGNNQADGHEGAIYKNVIGTYMHGSLLPKNPKIADFLIKTAALNKLGSWDNSKDIDDSIANRARAVAISRPR